MAGRTIRGMAVFTLTLLTISAAVTPALASGLYDYTVIFKQAGVDKPLDVRAWMPDGVPKATFSR
jgi:hypothetical protein